MALIILKQEEQGQAEQLAAMPMHAGQEEWLERLENRAQQDAEERK